MMIHPLLPELIRSFFEHDYYLYREKRIIHLYDTARRSHWKVRYDLDA